MSIVKYLNPYKRFYDYWKGPAKYYMYSKKRPETHKDIIEFNIGDQIHYSASDCNLDTELIDRCLSTNEPVLYTWYTWHNYVGWGEKSRVPGSIDSLEIQRLIKDVENRVNENWLMFFLCASLPAFSETAIHKAFFQNPLCEPRILKTIVCDFLSLKDKRIESKPKPKGVMDFGWNRSEYVFFQLGVEKEEEEEEEERERYKRKTLS